MGAEAGSAGTAIGVSMSMFGNGAMAGLVEMPLPDMSGPNSDLALVATLAPPAVVGDGSTKSMSMAAGGAWFKNDDETPGAGVSCLAAALTEAAMLFLARTSSRSLRKMAFARSWIKRQYLIHHPPDKKKSCTYDFSLKAIKRGVEQDVGLVDFGRAERADRFAAILALRPQSFADVNELYLLVKQESDTSQEINVQLRSPTGPVHPAGCAADGPPSQLRKCARRQIYKLLPGRVASAVIAFGLWCQGEANEMAGEMQVMRTRTRHSNTRCDAMQFGDWGISVQGGGSM